MQLDKRSNRNHFKLNYLHASQGRMGEVEELAGITAHKCSRVTRDGKREAMVDAKKQWEKAATKCPTLG